MQLDGPCGGAAAKARAEDTLDEHAARATPCPDAEAGGPHSQSASADELLDEVLQVIDEAASIVAKRMIASRAPMNQDIFVEQIVWQAVLGPSGTFGTGGWMFSREQELQMIRSRAAMRVAKHPSLYDLLQLRTRLGAAKSQLQQMASTTSSCTGRASTDPRRNREHAATSTAQQSESLPANPTESSGSSSAQAQAADTVLLYQGDDEDSLCVICMETLPDVAFQPCGHAVACGSCAAKVVARMNCCPVCRCQLLTGLPYASAQLHA
ncbi:hypothetical protein WJX84_011763 [Apatococcus fuscideae]|uniref:RING-type domain-containing protein n=1 Tax=Apatococcus fuscideae TaxID=2026836 RepID=A0AAW1TGD2_9CHLO